jgi:Protein of unknown function (DUF3800)
MVLNAYVDVSGKGDPHFLVLAGYIANTDAWVDFSKAWQTKLDEAGLAYFKMNEMVSRPEIAGYFYRTIEEHDIKAAVSCVIRTDELIQVQRTIRYPPYIIETSKLENPYYFGFKAITDMLAQHQPKLGIAEPVHFIFDDEGEKVHIPRAWSLMKENSSPEVLALMGDTPVYHDDKKALPLQAADLFAWWILKWEREGRDWGRDLPFPWGIKRDVPRLVLGFEAARFSNRSIQRSAKIRSHR